MLVDRLPTHPYLICSSLDCGTKTTCYGPNLHTKIKQFGGVENLLRDFKCRQCRTSNQPLTKAKIKRVKQPRVTRAETRAIRVKELIDGAPKYDFSERKNVAFLRDSPDLVRSITLNGSCIRPDIFLDSNRVCDDCYYNTTCEANVKTFSKQYKP